MYLFFVITVTLHFVQFCLLAYNTKQQDTHICTNLSLDF